jgi:hypothetical protein
MAHTVLLRDLTPILHLCLVFNLYYISANNSMHL